jgi:hypothetical protein
MYNATATYFFEEFKMNQINAAAIAGSLYE